MKNAHDLTIIMPVKNRLSLTRQAIDTLGITTHFKYRTIIMADNVDAEMREYLDSTGLEVHHCNFGQYIEPQSGLTVGQDVMRALAVSVIDTPYLYFSDNDIYFTAGWLARLFDIYMSDEDMGIVGGRTHAYHKIVDQYDTYRTTHEQAGYTMLMSKEVWNECGPYRQRFDDVGLCQSVINKGYKIAQPNEPVLFHCGLTRSDGLKVIGYEEEIKQPFPPGCITL